MLHCEGETEEFINAPFTKAQLNGALKRTKPSAPGKDQICYIMINHLSVMETYSCVILILVYVVRSLVARVIC